MTLSNPNILKTISNSSRVISEKISFRRPILIFPTDPDVAFQSISLTVFGNVTLENILCKIYRFVKRDIVLVDFSVQKVLYAQQSCKNVIATLVVHKFYMKERKKNNNACQSKPISLIAFLIELLYDKTTIE